MSRLTPIIFAVFLACAAVSPTAASTRSFGSSNIIAQKSAAKGAENVYLAHGLLSGHTYRIEILSAGHVGVSAQGFMNYTYIANHRLLQGTKSLLLHGKSPYSFTVKPPTTARISQWTLVVNASVIGKHPLTVRYRDLGVRK